MGVCSVGDTKSVNYCLNETFREKNDIIFNHLEKIGQITHLLSCDGINGIDDAQMYI